MPMHDVITAKLTVDIPVDLEDPDTVRLGAERAEALLAAAKKLGHATMPKPRFGRVRAPEPKPVAAEPGDDAPGFLKRRTAETEAAE